MYFYANYEIIVKHAVIFFMSRNVEHYSRSSETKDRKNIIAVKRYGPTDQLTDGRMDKAEC